MYVVFVTGQAQYPVERVLLTSGVLTAAIDCRYTALCQAAVPQLAIKEALSVAKKRIETPWLNVAYRSYEKGFWRPLGSQPSGALMSAYDDRTPPLSARL